MIIVNLPANAKRLENVLADLPLLSSLLHVFKM